MHQLQTVYWCGLMLMLIVRLLGGISANTTYLRNSMTLVKSSLWIHQRGTF